MMSLKRPHLTYLTAFVILASTSLAHAERALTRNDYVAPDSYVAPARPAKTVFRTQSGASLRETLEAWAKQASWKPIRWNLPEDTNFTLGESRQVGSDLEQSAKVLLEAIGSEADLRLDIDRANLTLVVSPKQ